MQLTFKWLLHKNHSLDGKAVYTEQKRECITVTVFYNQYKEISFPEGKFKFIMQMQMNTAGQSSTPTSCLGPFSSGNINHHCHVSAHEKSS